MMVTPSGRRSSAPTPSPKAIGMAPNSAASVVIRMGRKRSMQAAVMASLEKQAVRAADSFAPDAMLKLWFTALPQMSTQIQDMFTRMMASAGGRS